METQGKKTHRIERDISTRPLRVAYVYHDLSRRLYNAIYAT